MNSFTTDQLLMCEKEDLVKYIEELKDEYHYMEDKCVHQDDVYDYVESDGKVILDTDEYEEMEKEIKKLKTCRDLIPETIKKINEQYGERLEALEQRKPVTRSDTRIKQLEEEVDKLQLQSRLYDECVVKGMKNHIKNLNDECGGLKERLIDMSFKVDELESQIELTDECVIDGLKQGHKDLQEEIDRLQEENEKLKELAEINILKTYRDEMSKIEKLTNEEVEDILDVAPYIKKLKEEIKKLKEENEELKNKDVRSEIKKSQLLQKKVRNISRDANEISVVMMKICKHYTDIYSE
jgi:chromosome segregation ATPase